MNDALDELAELLLCMYGGGETLRYLLDKVGGYVIVSLAMKTGWVTFERLVM